jgi:N-sulfoglucosamine sulfohydrolase
MEATGIEPPAGLDGRSVVPLLRGEAQDKRDFVFTQIDYTIGGPAKPMRCIQDKHYGYIFNAFSDGTFAYRNNNEGLTMKAMVEAGQTDPAIQARVDMFRHRVPQEFYDLEDDPGCTKNLIDSPAHQELAKKYQDRLRQWMVETNDHCLTAYDVRSDPQALAAEMERYPKLVKPGKKDKPSKRKKASDPERAAKRRAKRKAAKNGQL